MDNKIKKQEKDYFAPIVWTIAIAALCFGLITYKTDYEMTDDAYVEGRLITVSSKIPGYVLHQYCEDKQEVNKGDILLELDPSLYGAAYQKAQDDLKKAKIKLSLIRQGLMENTDNVDVEEPRRNLFSRFHFGQSNFENYHTKYEDKYTLEKEANKDCLTEAVTKDEKELKKEEQKAIQELKRKDNEEPEKDEKRINLHEEIQRLEAEVEQAKLNLSYTRVFAPRSGTISTIKVSEGEYIASGQALYSIIPKRVWICANFTKEQSEKIYAGQAVTVKISTFPTKKFKGVVDSVNTFSKDPENNGSNKVPVRIMFIEDYSEFNINPGTAVSVRVKTR